LSESFASNFRKGQDIWNGWLITKSIPVSDYSTNFIFILFYSGSEAAGVMGLDFRKRRKILSQFCLCARLSSFVQQMSTVFSLPIQILACCGYGHVGKLMLLQFITYEGRLPWKDHMVPGEGRQVWKPTS
jgi:hypothetical protein